MLGEKFLSSKEKTVISFFNSSRKKNTGQRTIDKAAVKMSGTRPGTFSCASQYAFRQKNKKINLKRANDCPAKLGMRVGKSTERCWQFSLFGMTAKFLLCVLL